jgi:indole-3-glycerol phosphate synthase
MNQKFLSQMRDLVLTRVASSRDRVGISELTKAADNQPKPVDFIAAMRQVTHPRIIAEVKRRSPSRGSIAEELSPVDIAKCYGAGGAAAISVLTEPNFFGGKLADLRTIRSAVPGIALLMKDFVLDEYQLFEARAHGADAVLLIHSFLEISQLKSLFKRALDLGMTPLVEVHDEAEFLSALELQASLIGVNSRNLQTLEVHSERPLELANLKRGDVFMVAESGISSREQINGLSAAGYDGFLIGTALTKDKNPAHALRVLLGEV